MTGTQPANRVVVFDKADRTRALELVRGIRAEHCPVEVAVRPYDPSRTLPQNRRHWAMLRDLAEHMEVVMHGEWHDPEAWHVYFCKRFLGLETEEILGETVVRYKSSKDLGVQGFSDLDTQIDAYMKTEFEWSWDEGST